jgi:PAS domain S-box-containing protein
MRESVPCLGISHSERGRFPAETPGQWHFAARKSLVPPPTPRFPVDFDSLEDFLSAVIDSSDDAIITKNLTGVVTSWNAGAERLFGYAAEEMVGRPIMVLIPPDRQNEEPMILQRLRAGERVDHFDTKRRHKDGRELDISLTISPVKNRAGIIVGASKIARDITLQKSSAALLEKANEETARQSRMKDEFLTTLSHELRTPLQSIVGWVQLLTGGRATPDDLEQGLEVIGRAARAQQHIIEDLLDMNRILSGKVRLEVTKISLGEVVEAALQTLSPTAQAKGVRLHALLDPLSAWVMGDFERLQQVFWNLLANAIKFTPAGGRVEIRLERTDSSYEVSVTDTGVGIDSDFLPHVFDRFRQADASSTRTHAGLGLGLAIVKHLVELHGGRVFVKSAGLSKGATFSVLLPIAAVLVSEGKKTKRVSDKSTETYPLPQLKGITVLVVDDDADSRLLVAKTLEKVGARVRTAEGVDKALDLVDEALPDVIVSDLGMPEKNGYMLMQILRARSPERGGKIPAAALTAYTRVEDRVNALCAGFQLLLPKPVDAAELTATVASLAKQAR